MKIFADVSEAAERLEELIELARRGDEVLICRAGKPVAELTALPKTAGTSDNVSALTRERHARRPGRHHSHNGDLDDEAGLSQ